MKSFWSSPRLLTFSGLTFLGGLMVIALDPRPDAGVQRLSESSSWLPSAAETRVERKLLTDTRNNPDQERLFDSRTETLRDAVSSKKPECKKANAYEDLPRVDCRDETH